MAKTASTMLALGSVAPDFSLPTPDGTSHTFAELRGKLGTLVMFICNHCPYVIHLKKELSKLGQESLDRGVGVVAINSNDYEKYQDDSPQKMQLDSKEFNYRFPYLIDQDQSVAKAYRASCTPDFFLFDSKDLLVYRGQFDASRPGNDQPVNGEDLRNAVSAICDGIPISDVQTPSIGCNIKWQPGNEPDYF